MKTEEDGAVTVWGLFIFLMMCVISAVGLDFAKLMTARTQLQNTADSAAHAALASRYTNDAATAKVQGIALANANMPTSLYGTTLNAADIEFGTFDTVNQIFTADPNATEAVRVTTNQLASRGNGVASLLFQFVGYSEFDVRASAVFTTYYPGCLTEGYYAVDVVDMQSNNAFFDGFSICSNGHVEVNNNNTFEAGTTVCMPDSTDLVIPSSGWALNPGLAEALGSCVYLPKVLAELPNIIAGLAAGDPDYVPDFITSLVPKTLGNKNVSSADLTAGSVHLYWCSGNQTLKFSGLISDVVVVTDCKVGFANNTQLQDVTIATTNTGSQSIRGAVGLEIGTDDSCAVGGGAQLLTMGSFFSPAKIKLFGGQVIAADDITFAANATGIHGASFIAGGSIDATSNAQMSYCATGMEGNFEEPYFRLAR